MTDSTKLEFIINKLSYNNLENYDTHPTHIANVVHDNAQQTKMQDHSLPSFNHHTSSHSNTAAIMLKLLSPFRLLISRRP